MMGNYWRERKREKLREIERNIIDVKDVYGRVSNPNDIDCEGWQRDIDLLL